jgi:hypothetical protein
MMFTSPRTKGVIVSRTRNGRYNAQLGQTLFAVLSAVTMACTPSGTHNGGVGVLASPQEFGNGAPTSNYVRQLNFSPDTSYFAPYACTGCSGEVTLEFQPLADTYNVDWVPAVNAPNRGSVVARVRNVSNETFNDGNFKLEPYNVTHQYAYAWVGHAKRNDGTDWLGFGVYTLNESTGVVTGEWSLVAPAKIQVCTTANPHTKPAIHKMPPPSVACHYLAQNNPSIITRLASLAIPKAYAASTRSATAALGGLGGLWISCSGGCCQVSTN